MTPTILMSTVVKLSQNFSYSGYNDLLIKNNNLHKYYAHKSLDLENFENTPYDSPLLMYKIKKDIVSIKG